MQRSLRLRSRIVILLRIILFSVALPVVYLGVASGAFYYRLRVRNTANDAASLPLLRAFTSNDRVLIVAPHCDDETLGAAGLIQRVVAAGGVAESVIITNGDAYPAAVERQQRVLKATPTDYVQFAMLRQKESQQAGKRLGVQKVLFLGYPDRGLMDMWERFWNVGQPYYSTYTCSARSPYPNTYNKNSEYCGEDLTRDLASIVSDFKPTLVVVAHPGEDHTDHAAAANFVTLAVMQTKAKEQNQAWARNIELMHYLVHRGDWPLPQGKHPEARLLPPVTLAGLDTNWFTLFLTKSELANKASAIEMYPSQTAIMPGFMQAFARKSELFGTIPERTLDVTLPSEQFESAISSRESPEPLLRDPIRDSLIRDMQGGADIAALYCTADAAFLHIGIETRLPISSSYRYRLIMRSFARDWQTHGNACSVDIEPDSSVNAESTIKFRTKGSRLTVDIPWRVLSAESDGEPASAISVAAVTYLKSIPVEVDRTETRLVKLLNNASVQTQINRQVKVP